MPVIGAASYSLGAVSFLILTVLLLTGWRGRLQGGLLVLATGGTTLWAAVFAVQAYQGGIPVGVMEVVETVHFLVWFLFLFHLLRHANGVTSSRGGMLTLMPIIVYGLSGLLLLFPLLRPYLPGGLIADDTVPGLVYFGYVVLTVCGLLVVENLYRNTRPEQRWGIKFLCMGIGGMYTYDFFLYAHALLFQQIDPNLWIARGTIYALVVPLIGISVARNPDWSLNVFISRDLVFHTATLLAAGIYLLVMAAAGYYIKLYGEEWGAVLQIIFLFGAAVVLFIMLFSGQLRARIKVLLSKHFFHYRYDYREQWLKLTEALSRCSTDALPQECIVRTMGEVVDSPGGLLWIQDKSGSLRPAAHWGMQEPEGAAESMQGSLARFLENREWVINLEEYQETPELYEGLELPAWLTGMPRAWLIVPLINQGELLGFTVLAEPRARVPFNWELRDLLKTVACQAASHLAQLQAVEALAESRQFEGFHRLAAFVLHDIKNLIAQQSLVVSSAARHKHKPEFVDDAIGIMEHSVSRMHRLMALLRSGLPEGRPVLVNLVSLVQDAVNNRSDNLPVPVFHSEVDQIPVMVDRDRFTSVIENTVQNAQDATANDGFVKVQLSSKENTATITIEDNGCGMDAAFIRDRLFRPFDTTKGDTGMGIGAHDSREYVRVLGGDIGVSSEPGKGTVFRITLPLAPEEHHSMNTVEHLESAG